MRGFPKTLGTKADLDNLMAMPEFKAAADEQLKKIAAARFVWVQDKILIDAKDGKESDTEKVVTDQDTNGKPKLVQMKLVEDEEAAIYRLGFKPEEVAELEKQRE